MTDRPHILIVDDDKFLLDMYCLKFSQAGYVVQPCFSVAEALDAIRDGYDPSVILFDVTMPGEDGFHLLQKLREEKLAPNALLIALTNQSSDADRKRAEDLGVRRYVIKASMVPSEVVSVVKEELARK